MKEGSLKTFQNFKKSLTKPKKGREKSHSAKKLESGNPSGFCIFVFEAGGFWMRSESSAKYFW